MPTPTKAPVGALRLGDRILMAGAFPLLLQLRRAALVAHHHFAHGLADTEALEQLGAALRATRWVPEALAKRGQERPSKDTQYRRKRRIRALEAMAAGQQPSPAADSAPAVQSPAVTNEQDERQRQSDGNQPDAV